MEPAAASLELAGGDDVEDGPPSAELAVAVAESESSGTFTPSVRCATSTPTPRFRVKLFSQHSVSLA